MINDFFEGYLALLTGTWMTAIPVIIMTVAPFVVLAMYIEAHYAVHHTEDYEYE